MYICEYCRNTLDFINCHICVLLCGHVLHKSCLDKLKDLETSAECPACQISIDFTKVIRKLYLKNDLIDSSLDNRESLLKLILQELVQIEEISDKLFKPKKNNDISFVILKLWILLSASICAK
ncbi:hypothetical protein GJ496_006608 [Pomphorhynchus laevis]|nr:hypothetical protein GJ496_006608 [Pomphorhynchus laevis]